VNLLHKQHIIQCTAGGYSQYPTQVQECPTQVKAKIEKQISKHLWNGKMSKVNKETMHTPINHGGMKILNTKARNKVIHLIWLKCYLGMSAVQPLCASFANTLLTSNIPVSEEHLDAKLHQNLLLQTWSIFQGYQCQTCPSIRELINTTKNHTLRLEAFDVPQTTADTMPIWLHKQADLQARPLIKSGYLSDLGKQQM
jgi:hypothetical protein